MSDEQKQADYVGPIFGGAGDRVVFSSCAGMSLRDYFAAKVVGKFTFIDVQFSARLEAAADAARWAYEVADAMLAERAK